MKRKLSNSGIRIGQIKIQDAKAKQISPLVLPWWLSWTEEWTDLWLAPLCINRICTLTVHTKVELPKCQRNQKDTTFSSDNRLTPATWSGDGPWTYAAGTTYGLKSKLEGITALSTTSTGPQFHQKYWTAISPSGSLLQTQRDQAVAVSGTGRVSGPMRMAPPPCCCGGVEGGSTYPA
jgi:hypothetical protein